MVLVSVLAKVRQTSTLVFFFSGAPSQTISVIPLKNLFLRLQLLGSKQTEKTYAYLWDPKILSRSLSLEPELKELFFFLLILSMSLPNTSPERRAEMRSSKSFSFSPPELLSPAVFCWPGLLLLLREVRSRARRSRSTSRRCRGTWEYYRAVFLIISKC